MLKRILLITAIIVFAFFSYSLYQVLEYYEEEQDLGWTQQARRNPYLALVNFSLTQDVTLKVVDSYTQLGDLNQFDFLYLSDSKLVFTEQRLAQLLNWVQRGGSLLVDTSLNDDNESDRLLDHLNVSISKTDYKSLLLDHNSLTNAKDSEEAAREIKKKIREYNRAQSEKKPTNDHKGMTFAEKLRDKENSVTDKELTRLTFDTSGDELTAHFSPSTQLFHPSMNDKDWTEDDQNLLYWQSSGYGPQFVQLEYGSGLVSIMSGNDILNSKNIAYFDHAYIWQVLTGHHSGAILFGSNMPSLWFILRQIMPEVILSTALFLMLWFWYTVGRFGPIREPSFRSRRAFSEHLAASAGFFWRHQWQNELLQPLRDELTYLAETRLSGFDIADPETRIHLLASHCGYNEDRVHMAMHSHEKLSDENFLKIVQTLQKLRDSL